MDFRPAWDVDCFILGKITFVLSVLLYFVFQTSYYMNIHFHLIAVRILSTYLNTGRAIQNQFIQPYSWDRKT